MVAVRTRQGVKALVVGCGSVGKRHIANLSGIDAVAEIAVFTRNAGCLSDMRNEGKIRIVNSLDDAEADFAVIANETHKHLDTAILLAGRGLHLFIEKPLSHSLERVEVLRKIVEKNRVAVGVGYNLRFLGIMRCLKRLLSENAVGDIYFAKIEAGQYLPAWRPGVDYRQSYSARAARGGGVALDLSHEIDYMRMLFGDPCVWTVHRAKVSKLEIDSEDMFEGVYLFPGSFICNVHLDYLQMIKKREIRIAGSRGTIVCDLVNKDARLTVDARETVFNDEEMFDLDGSYAAEIQHFIRVVQEGEDPMITLSDGISALRLLENGHVQGP